jgi:ATP phosphoribosyltransferase
VQEDDPASDVASLRPGSRIASAFPRITRDFFERAGVRITLVPVSGAAEVAPHLGVADAIVDITSTGSTLRQNGLRELATVLTSSARLIAGPTVGADAPDKQHHADELKAALESVLTARGKRYLMANVPRAKLDEVSRILPGLNGPTVIDILNGGEHVAVHAVVDAGNVYRTIADLKLLGAEGILVTRIERLMA